MGYLEKFIKRRIYGMVIPDIAEIEIFYAIESNAFMYSALTSRRSRETTYIQSLVSAFVSYCSLRQD